VLIVFNAVLIIALAAAIFVVWITWAWKTQEANTLQIDDDEAEIRLLFIAYCAAVQKAIEAAEKSPKPLEGNALRRFLEADAEATNVVRRIKEIRTSQGRDGYIHK
jgi:hypothetical protein